MNFTNMNDCCKNDTFARNEFLMSVRIRSLGGQTKKDVNESSLSVWSEDVTAPYMGRHFTLKPSITLTPKPDGILMFELNNTFDYKIWIHDEKFFLPNRSPFGPPGEYWKYLTKYDKNKTEQEREPGLYHRITLTKQKKLNLKHRPCKEDPSYSFSTCIKEKLSQRIGCRLPWDRWSNQDRNVCKSESEFRNFERNYINLHTSESDEMAEEVGCRKPCSYNEFKFVFGSPEVNVRPSVKNMVAFWAASRKTLIEEEVLLYPFTSFIAEFGGALGLFLGFSFITIWQEIRGWIGK